jgi:hypothetical protein
VYLKYSSVLSSYIVSYPVGFLIIKPTRCTNFSNLFFCSSILILLASCQQICMTYTIAMCTVKSFW